MREVDDPLQRFREVMLVSSITSSGLCILLLLLTVWRGAWQKLLNLEEGFWRRLRVSEQWLRKFRGIEENRYLVPALAVLLLLHICLFGFAAAAHTHFSKQIKGRAPVVLPVPAKKSQ